MKKLFLAFGKVLAVILVVILLMITTLSIYDFCTVSHAPIFVNHQKSYIKSVSLENESLICTVVLHIKNIHRVPIECNKIELVLWGKDGDMEKFEDVDAEPKTSDLSYIRFPALRSKVIECTFEVSDFGAPLSIDNIDISSSSYR